jgi:hypothetical protein
MDVGAVAVTFHPYGASHGTDTLSVTELSVFDIKLAIPSGACVVSQLIWKQNLTPPQRTDRAAEIDSDERVSDRLGECPQQLTIDDNPRSWLPFHIGLNVLSSDHLRAAGSRREWIIGYRH